jgi:hypothetical protein
VTVVTDIQSRLSYAHNMEILAADRDGLLEELHVLQVRLDDMQGHLVDMKLHLRKVQDQIRAGCPRFAPFFGANLGSSLIPRCARDDKSKKLPVAS